MGRRSPSRSDGRLLAGEGNEHFMFTVRATNSGKAFMQIATLEIGFHRLLDDRSPVAVLGLVPLERKLAEKSQNADRSNATSRRPADRTKHQIPINAIMFTCPMAVKEQYPASRTGHWRE